MKSKLSLVGLFCLFASFAFAQTVPFPTHTDNDNTVPFPDKMDDVFGNVVLTDVTTNLLLDRAWPFAKPEAFDGSISADTVKSHKHWLKLYGTMATAATAQPGPIPSINDWKAQRDAEESIQLLNNTGNAHSHTLIQFYLRCVTYNLNHSNNTRIVLPLSKVTFLT